MAWLAQVTNNELLEVNQPSAFDGLGLTRTQRLYGFFGCMGGAFTPSPDVDRPWLRRSTLLAGGFILSILGAVMFIVSLQRWLSRSLAAQGTEALVGIDRLAKRPSSHSSTSSA